MAEKLFANSIVSGTYAYPGYNDLKQKHSNEVHGPFVIRKTDVRLFLPRGIYKVRL